MSEQFENVKREIAQLTEVVKSAGADRAVLDYDKLAEAIAKASAQVRANEPVRRGEEIESPAAEGSDGKVKGGKYDGLSYNDVLMAGYLMERAKVLSGNKNHPGASKELQGAIGKALTATGAGTGDEFVPTGMAAELWNDMFLDSRVAAQFAQAQMPTDPWDWPLGWGDPTWRKGTQNTATTVSDPATAKSTMTTTEQVVEFNWSYDLDEDSIIATLPTLRDLIGRTGAEQIDRFVMNADATSTATGNINLDDDTPAASAYYLSNGQDGIRHLYIVDNTAQSTDINSTLEDAELRAAIGRLGKYASDVGNLVMFVDPKTYAVSMLGLTNVVTVDKFGPQATVLTGQLAAYGGIPVIPTPAIALAEDDGKLSTTGSNNDEGQIAIVHRPSWRVGFKRNLTIELDRDVQKRQLIMVASFRIAVAARGTRSTATHTSGVHGITYA